MAQGQLIFRASRVEPIIKVQALVPSQLDGIVYQASNAKAEGIDSGIRRGMLIACGFRKTERFRRAICIYLGKLDLSPALWFHPKPQSAADCSRACPNSSEGVRYTHLHDGLREATAVSTASL
ncbi:MAG: hypothetical protein ACI9EF_000804 [Pseudohongiellaceae bacterium]